jgi:hypothetical protein
MKFCKDCTYFMSFPLLQLTECHAIIKEVDLVFGNKIYADARDMRAPDGPCGPGGTLYSQKWHTERD